MKTVGISPKVLLPLAVGIVVGIVFLAFGLTVEGETVLFAAASYAGLGAAVGPGKVEKKVKPHRPRKS